MLLTLTSVRLQNWNGLSQFHSKGWFPVFVVRKVDVWFSSVSMPLLASIGLENSFVTLCRKSTAELLARPRCGLVSHQLPTWQSSRYHLRKQGDEAARRIPPAKTASAIWQTISWTSIADSGRHLPSQQEHPLLWPSTLLVVVVLPPLTVTRRAPLGNITKIKS